jgi:hypothetical protein
VPTGWPSAVRPPDSEDWEKTAVAAAARQPGRTLMLRSDRLTQAEPADEVLARADLRQAHGDGKRTRQARSLDSKGT